MLFVQDKRIALKQFYNFCWNYIVKFILDSDLDSWKKKLEDFIWGAEILDISDTHIFFRPNIKTKVNWKPLCLSFVTNAIVRFIQFHSSFDRGHYLAKAHRNPGYVSKEATVS